MFSLTSTFEDELNFQGEFLPLDFSFDNVLRLFDLLKDETFTGPEKVEIALEMLLREHYENVKPLPIAGESGKHSLFLYILKKYLDIDLDKQADSEAPKVKPDFDFEQDAGIIYASFLQAYNMDLIQQQGKLHWKQFIELFYNLPEESKMQKVRGYRSRKMPAATAHNKEERKDLAAMKKHYRLKGTEEEEQLEQKFEMLAMWKRKK